MARRVSLTRLSKVRPPAMRKFVNEIYFATNQQLAASLTGNCKMECKILNHNYEIKPIATQCFLKTNVRERVVIESKERTIFYLSDDLANTYIYENFLHYVSATLLKRVWEIKFSKFHLLRE